MSETGSVHALNRSLDEWFTLVRTGSLRLPRFQRHEAWDRGTVVSLVETVLRGLPAGAALVLNVGEPEPFISRHLVTAPQVSGRVTEHLLDGQQRLTALWRSLHGTYDDLSLFVTWQHDDDHGGETAVVVSQPRWVRKGTRYPVWCDDPKSVMSRGFIPLTLLAPDAHQSTSTWLRAACDDLADAFSWTEKLAVLRQRIAAYNIPYLYLPQGTPKDVALDVFIKMNTSNIRLSPFDIVVAQVEAAAGISMHELLEGVRTEVPDADAYGDLGTLLLDIACLHAGRPATKANYLRLDYARLPEQWGEMTDSLRFVVSLLEGEGVFDEVRLPSSAVVPVVAALAQDLPASGDGLGNARALLRYYVWRSFLTRRYESSTASRAFQDYQTLRGAIRDGTAIESVTAPVFDEGIYPIPTVEQLLGARWPKSRDILARGILAMSLKEGARDIADDTPATRVTVRQREYHHLFPDSILVKRAGLSEAESFRALNCALITWQTNRQVSNRSPLEYLADRVTKANLGEAEVAARLASHLVPYDSLKDSGPYDEGPSTGGISADYDRFLESRAAIVATRAADLAGAGKVGVDHFGTQQLDRSLRLSDVPSGSAAGGKQQQKQIHAAATDPPSFDVVAARFETAMKSVYRRAKAEAGYDAKAFLGMLSRHGGLETARRLIASPAISDGFAALWERDRLDLVVENVVLKDEFAELFTAEEIETAERRLAEYGYWTDRGK